MGTITVGRIIDRVLTKLLEEDPSAPVRWTRAELLADYNAVKNAIVAFKPDLGARAVTMALQAGVLQEIPASCYQFTRATRNMGANGATPGAGITIVDKDDMDHGVHGWVTATGTAVQHYIPVQDDPRRFYVYPAVAAPWYIEILAIGSLEDADADADVIPLPDVMEDCLFAGVLSAAYAKNTVQGDDPKVAFWLGQFKEALGLKAQAQVRFVPVAAAQDQRKEM